MTNTSEQKPQSGLPQIGKDLLVLVPLLASGLAISYDVGFFRGIGLGYFAFFTISEHIVFALEAFPAALLGALGLGAFVYFYRPHWRQIGGSRRHPWRARFLGYAIGAALVGIATAYYTKGSILSVGLSMLLVVLLMVTFEVESLLLNLLIACVAAALAAFFLGILMAVGATRQGPSPCCVSTIETNSFGTIRALVVRSGERGVLFYNSQIDQLVLLRWDEIKQISRSPARP
jgi:hypothetical protein